MSDTTPPPPPTLDPEANELPSSSEGRWGLDLWDGAAWFSDWFYQRLQWPIEVTRQQLDDLQPYMSPDDWEALLVGLRSHLELKIPLEVQVSVQLPSNRTENWHIQGSAERNAAGQPVYVSGSMREVSDEGRNDPHL